MIIGHFRYKMRDLKTGVANKSSTIVCYVKVLYKPTFELWFAMWRAKQIGHKERERYTYLLFYIVM